MSSTTPTEQAKSYKSTKVVIPKVWKRPHSTIYGKNVEFGSKLYSDKLGEINGRKFNSELPWQMRNSGGMSTGSSSSSGSQQGYISRVLSAPESTLIGSVLSGSGSGGSRYSSEINNSSISNSNSGSGSLACNNSLSLVSPSQLPVQNYADLLEITNPYRYGKKRQQAAQLRAQILMNAANKGARPKREPRIDFYDQYMDTFNRDLHQMSEQSILLHEPLLHRRVFDKYLDFNHEIGVFVPNSVSSSSSSSDNNDSIRNSSRSNSSLKNNNCMPLVFNDDGRSLIYKRTLNKSPIVMNNSNVKTIDESRATSQAAHTSQKDADQPFNIHNKDLHSMDYINTSSFTPVCTTTQQTSLLPKHHCQLASSPYGQSADGRKLSLGSINPHSYRPSLPSKSSTVHASDGEEFEFHDRSSPFYTDRWAGKTIRHFDSDLYSNANLFKSMIL